MGIEMDRDAERLHAITESFESGTPEPAIDALPWLLKYVKRLQDVLVDSRKKWDVRDNKASNSYPFLAACEDVEQVIKASGHTMIALGIGRSDVARSVVARLVHAHHLISLRDPEQPLMQCPNCGVWEPDFDGMGMMAHYGSSFPNPCGWCSHPGYDDGKCTICGKPE